MILTPLVFGLSLVHENIFNFMRACSDVSLLVEIDIKKKNNFDDNMSNTVNNHWILRSMITGLILNYTGQHVENIRDLSQFDPIYRKVCESLFFGHKTMKY